MRFRVEHEGDNFYTIKDVPIFKTHSDRGYNCDYEWMQAAVNNFKQYRQEDHRPTVILGHNVKGVEKKSYGFLDNFSIKPVTKDGKTEHVLYADLVRVPKDLKEDITRNAYPSRSVEVLPYSKRILALALLGSTPPYFALPQMTYADTEPSKWYRSPNMPFNDEEKNEIKGLLADALKGVLPEALATYSAQVSKGPEIIEIPYAQSITMYNNGQLPDNLVQTEDGEFYSEADNGKIYHYNFLTRGLEKVGGSVSRGIGRAGEYLQRTGNAAGPGKGLRRMTAAQRLLKAGEFTGEHALGTGVGTVAAGTVAAGGTGMAARHIFKRDDGAGYSIDPNTGIVYYEGDPVGQVAPLEDEQLPPEPEGHQAPAPPNPAAVGNDTNKPTELMQGIESKAGPFIEPTDEESSDQFQLQASNAINDQQVQLYSLQQEVQQLRVANALLAEGKKVEQYKKYLLDLKQQGTAIGDVDAHVDYMMSLNDNQVKGYKKTLEAAPKVQLGRMNYTEGNGDESKKNYTLDEQEIVADYQANQAFYNKLSVGVEDLKNARFVRVNRMQ